MVIVLGNYVVIIVFVDCIYNVLLFMYIEFYFIVSCIPVFTSKEKHSLTRKLVGYRNWRQWWCKKEGNKVLRKG